MRGINTIKSVIRRSIGVGSMEDRSQQQRMSMWPGAARLEDKHLKNCRLLSDREVMLGLLPQNAVCAEVGVWKGDFAETILQRTKPQKLHLVDFAAETIGIINSRFKARIESGQVQAHQGDSADTLASFPAAYFDWVYIDADHRYPAVKRDLEAVRTRMKPGGLIALNDYVYFSSIDFAKYGVIEAVHEFCLQYDYELFALALHPRMNCDVLLRPIWS